MKSGEKDHSALNIFLIVIIASVAGAVTVSYIIKLPTASSGLILYPGEFFILAGIIFRLIVIRSLGKYFTVDVTIKEDHKIKKEGFYRYLRHPSYAFSLLTFLGLGLFLNNWLSFILAFVPPFLAFSYRIKIEEQALVEQFGEEYIRYRNRTKKLIPFIY
ncbi:methyltransferase family protein [Chryseobacterium populi]|uniref:Isoprenylcysteine carboxyl methyltransferase (ICMT) family protein n=1 Tax=Chryseobacterium populi TaxID=1144316 RepID=J2TDE0_9FLAO|nr:isoprenylcysteine carboxylmethyltransferase family protein [Chryseobacterium populi]EJL76217.1 hypothetical protein-S-isoprenylcysteine methyltransferase [Chryseobacterium populi]